MYITRAGLCAFCRVGWLVGVLLFSCLVSPDINKTQWTGLGWASFARGRRRLIWPFVISQVTCWFSLLLPFSFFVTQPVNVVQ